MTDQTIREGRQRYFDEFNLGEGGYDAKWVHLKLGPVPFSFPNTDSRKRAVRIHDLHHVVTGYRADWIGEFEISAWEVASSCRDFLAAWVLNLLGLAAGSVVATGRVFRAFARGRHTRNLYPEGVSDALLDEGLTSVQRRLGLHAPVEPTFADGLAFVGWASLAWALILGSVALVASPLVGLVWWLSHAG